MGVIDSTEDPAQLQILDDFTTHSVEQHALSSTGSLKGQFLEVVAAVVFLFEFHIVAVVQSLLLLP